MNLFHVQSLLGHSSLTMTRIYAEQVNSEDAIGAVVRGWGDRSLCPYLVSNPKFRELLTVEPLAHRSAAIYPNPHLSLRILQY